jgi:hypothetical protein
MLQDIATAIVHRIGERLVATRPNQGFVTRSVTDFDVQFEDCGCFIRRMPDNNKVRVRIIGSRAVGSRYSSRFQYFTPNLMLPTLTRFEREISDPSEEAELTDQTLELMGMMHVHDLEE